MILLIIFDFHIMASAIRLLCKYQNEEEVSNLCSVIYSNWNTRSLFDSANTVKKFIIHKKHETE